MSSSSKVQNETWESVGHIPPPPEHSLYLPRKAQIGTTRSDWLSTEIRSRIPTDLLLITVKDCEFISCYAYMTSILRSWVDKVGMVDFGEFGESCQRKVKVALIKSEMGPIKALISAKNAIETLKPKVTVFVGFCATLNSNKARLGDIVILAKLTTYSMKKITADGTEEPHGNIKAEVSRNVARLILSADQGWTPPLKDQSHEIKVHKQAVMLSGPELVDHSETRKKLCLQYPDAVALDMEGEGYIVNGALFTTDNVPQQLGLYAAAYDLETEWTVIKGVSDFADGSKKSTAKWQAFASAMAASVVHNMFKHSDVMQNWPHYGNYEVEPVVRPRRAVSQDGSRMKSDMPAGSIDDFIRKSNFGDSGQDRGDSGSQHGDAFNKYAQELSDTSYALKGKESFSPEVAQSIWATSGEKLSLPFKA